MFSFLLMVVRCVASAALIAQAGLSKIQNPEALLPMVSGLGFPAAIPPLYLAWACALAESVFAALLFVGFFTRVSAIVLTFNFAVACYAHVKLWGDSIEKIFTVAMPLTVPPAFPAGVYLAAFAIILLFGAGAMSVDGLLAPAKPTPKVDKVKGH